jgi:hypothetical protein
MNQPIFAKKRKLWWNTLLHWQFKGLYIGTLTTSYICARPCETELLDFLLHLVDAPNQPPICCASQGATHLTPATWKFLRAAQQASDLDFFRVFSFSNIIWDTLLICLRCICIFGGSSQNERPRIIQIRNCLVLKPMVRHPPFWKRTSIVGYLG